MTFVTAQPEMLTAAAGQLQQIGVIVAARNAAAATPTIGVVPAAADEVSALTATQFSAHATSHQTVSVQACMIDEMFVRMLAASGDSYASTEAANAIAAR
ncbi:MAG: PE family protein [Mycobacterium sp.]